MRRQTWDFLIELLEIGTDEDWRRAREAVDEARGTHLLSEALRRGAYFVRTIGGPPEPDHWREREWWSVHPDGGKERL